MFQKLLLLVITLLMLVAGFWQNGPDESRKPVWLAGGGLHFGGQSFVYADRFPPVRANPEGEVVIRLAIQPDFLERPRLGILLETFDRVTEQRVVVAQWDKSLVVMNTEDFSNRAKKPKIYATLPQDNQIHQVEIHSGAKGTRVLIDGVAKGHNRKLILQLPENPQRSYLVLGNGVRVRTPWNGSIHGLDIELRPAAALDPDTGSDLPPLLGYGFDEGQGNTIHDISPNRVDLMIPDKALVLQVSVLDVPAYVRLKQPWMKRDMILNFLGFIPFGFLLCRLLAGAGDNSPATALLLSSLIAFLFSLSIELTQVLLPERDSSLLDLVLNSGGGLCGAVLALLLERLRQQIKPKPGPG